jgi:hypothetical protein
MDIWIHGYPDIYYLQLCIVSILRTSILIKSNTRDELRRIGRKAQTYDQVIRELIISKNKLDMLEDESGNLHNSSLSINS